MMLGLKYFVIQKRALNPFFCLFSSVPKVKIFQSEGFPFFVCCFSGGMDYLISCCFLIFFFALFSVQLGISLSLFSGKSFFFSIMLPFSPCSCMFVRIRFPFFSKLVCRIPSCRGNEFSSLSVSIYNKGVKTVSVSSFIKKHAVEHI